MTQTSHRTPILVLESRSPWLGSGLDLTLHQPGLPWESEARALLFGEVRDLLASVPGWQIEYQPAIDPERLALFPKLGDPASRSERIPLAESLVGAIGRLSPQGRTLALIDWTLRPWLLAHPAIDGVDAPDEARHLELRGLRTPLLGPWLHGDRPVLNKAVFAEFHLELDAAERAVFDQLRQTWSGGLMSDELFPWQRSAARRLVARGFARVQTRKFGLGHTETRIVREPKGSHLASWEKLAR